MRLEENLGRVEVCSVTCDHSQVQLDNCHGGQFAYPAFSGSDNRHIRYLDSVRLTEAQTVSIKRKNRTTPLAIHLNMARSVSIDI